MSCQERGYIYLVEIDGISHINEVLDSDHCGELVLRILAQNPICTQPCDTDDNQNDNSVVNPNQCEIFSIMEGQSCRSGCFFDIPCTEELTRSGFIKTPCWENYYSKFIPEIVTVDQIINSDICGNQELQSFEEQCTGDGDIIYAFTESSNLDPSWCIDYCYSGPVGSCDVSYTLTTFVSELDLSLRIGSCAGLLQVEDSQITVSEWNYHSLCHTEVFFRLIVKEQR
eukprot:UN24851